MDMEMTTPSFKILLVEDESKIAEFVIEGLENAHYQVEHVTDGVSGLKHIFKNDYDLVLLDIMLPKLNGLELLQQLRQDGNTTPVIILSAKVELNDRLNGFELGADDYMPKPFFVEELIAKMKVILGRRQAAAPVQTLQTNHLSLDLVSRKAQWYGVEAVLSQREFTLLQYLMQTPGHIYSRQQILKNVWDISFDPETNVVDVCVQRIKRKLSRGHNDHQAPIESVRGVGYRVKAIAYE
jgi:two-component system OmpR family response regulator